MPRRVEDIIRTDRRTIRDIPVDESPRRPRESRASRGDTEEEVPIRKVPQKKIKLPPPPPARRKAGPAAGGGKKLWLIIVIAVVLVVGGTAFMASKYFSRATFTIYPITIPVAVNNATIVATGTSTPGYLRYDVIKYSGTASTTLPATDGPQISTKATGTVILYNGYAEQGQRLIAGTRFASDNGFIYRLPSSVFIPGYKMSNGSLVPGTLRATIVADEAGAQYNLNKGDGTVELKIVAYKGGPRYDTVYARLDSSLTGGFAGTKKTVNPGLLASTTMNLEETLLKVLQSQAKSGVPAGYITYDNAYTTSFSPPDVGGKAARSATVSVTGSLYNIIFKKNELVAKLAGSQNVDRFGKAAFATEGLEALKFTITNPGTFRPTKANTLIARLSGDISMKGVIPVSDLKKKLSGMSLADTRGIFASYSSIIDVGKSFGELFPSWASAVPQDENRINVIIKD